MLCRTRLRADTARLRAAGIDNAALEAKWLLADALGVSVGRLLAHMDTELTPAQERALDTWIGLREKGMPLQYAQGYQVFMGDKFFVNASVLIPRADTEILCELAIKRVGQACSDVLDLCTGSGALAVMLAKSCPNARVTATDISPDALTVARQNAAMHHVAIEFVQGDFLDAVKDRMFDLIVCNPPYLTDADMDSLQREVRYEPKLALAAGKDGLAFYRRARSIRAYLRPGGVALFEIGAGQANDVMEILRATRTVPDLAGIERVVEIM